MSNIKSLITIARLYKNNLIKEKNKLAELLQRKTKVNQEIRHETFKLNSEKKIANEIDKYDQDMIFYLQGQQNKINTLIQTIENINKQIVTIEENINKQFKQMKTVEMYTERKETEKQRILHKKEIQKLDSIQSMRHKRLIK